MLLVSVLLLLMAALTYVVLYFTASREVRISETWGCGAKSQPSTTEYTGHGFSEPIDTIFSSIYRTKKIQHKDPTMTSTTASFQEGTAEIRLLKVL